jgi:hypothetical protein
MTPDEARVYVAMFRTHIIPGTAFVHTNKNREICLDDMTDDEALFVAKGFKEMEVEAARKSKGRKQ